MTVDVSIFRCTYDPNMYRWKCNAVFSLIFRSCVCESVRVKPKSRMKLNQNHVYSSFEIQWTMVVAVDKHSIPSISHWVSFFLHSLFSLYYCRYAILCGKHHNECEMPFTIFANTLLTAHCMLMSFRISKS